MDAEVKARHVIHRGYGGPHQRFARGDFGQMFAHWTVWDEVERRRAWKVEAMHK